MTTTDTIEIPFNKKRFAVILTACTFCFLLGLWLVVYPPNLNLYFLIIPINKTFLGIALMAFFGYFIFKYGPVITGNKPGLTIDSNGVTDNSSTDSTGLILWADIQEIKVLTVNNQAFILLMVKNPEEYIARQSGIKKKLMQNFYKLHGTPILISVNGLNCTLDDLFKTLQFKYKESIQNRATNSQLV